MQRSWCHAPAHRAVADWRSHNPRRTAAHGLGRLRKRCVDAGVALAVETIGGVGHGLHKAVDQCGLGVQTRRSHDAASTDGTALQIGQKLLLPMRLKLRLFNSCQGTCHAGKQLLLGLLAVGQIFLGQHILADGLRRECVHGMPHANRMLTL